MIYKDMLYEGFLYNLINRKPKETDSDKKHKGSISKRKKL